jgi:phage shock protein E
MKRITGILLLLLASAPVIAQEGAATRNPRIDAQAFMLVTMEALQHRESRRLDVPEFMRLSNEPKTLVLDARSSERFRELHIDGAINLSFPDITEESLARLIPDKSTRILIYCNNNFTNAERAFPSKLPSASLNLSTYTALYNYGYRNVYELGPLIDAARTPLKLVASAR